MHTRQGVARPTPPKDIPSLVQPIVFEWYENRIEEGLSKLYRVDVEQRQHIVEIIREMEDSNMFWRLYAKYQDEGGESKDAEKQTAALKAFLARVYIAGSLRGHAAVDL